METKRLTCLTLGLALICVGTLGCPPPPVGPGITIVSPVKEISPMVLVDDPATTAGIPINVDVSFPAVSDLAGPHYVVTGTLQILLVQYNDGARGAEWSIVEDGSGGDFEWEYLDGDITKPIGITGSTTIGGVGSLQSYGNYKLWIVVYNDIGVLGQVSRTIRMEKPAEQFAGGTFEMRISTVYQFPGNCLIPDFVLDMAMGALGGTTFNTSFPDGDEYPTDPGSPILFQLPQPIGPAYADGAIDTVENKINLTLTDDLSMDLGIFGLGGFDCLIAGEGSGFISGQVSDDDVDATIWMENLDVTIGSGGCNLTPPTGSCRVTVVVDGNPL